MKTNEITYARETVELMGVLLADRKHRWTKDQRNRVERTLACLRKWEKVCRNAEKAFKKQ